MRIVDVRERSVAISQYRDATIPSGGLTTSIAAVVTDVVRGPAGGQLGVRVGRALRADLIRGSSSTRLLSPPRTSRPRPGTGSTRCGPGAR
jgi:hypothetical protein